jgi:hypothetical protein
MATLSFFIRDVNEQLSSQQIYLYLKDVLTLTNIASNIIWLPGWKRVRIQNGDEIKVRNIVVHADSWKQGTEELQYQYRQGKCMEFYYSRTKFWKAFIYRPRPPQRPRPFVEQPLETPSMWSLQEMNADRAFNIQADLSTRVEQCIYDGYRPHPETIRHLDIITGWIANWRNWCVYNLEETKWKNYQDQQRREKEERRKEEERIEEEEQWKQEQQKQWKQEQQRREEQRREQEEAKQWLKEQEKQWREEEERREQEEAEEEERREQEESEEAERWLKEQEEEEEEEEEETPKQNYGHSFMDIPQLSYEESTRIVYDSLPHIPPRVRKMSRTKKIV